MKNNKNLSKFTDAQLKLYKVLFIVLGSIITLLALPLLLSDFVFSVLMLFLAFLCFSVSKTYKKELQARIQRGDVSFKDNFDRSTLDTEIPRAEEAKPTTEHHNVTGTSHYEKSILELAEENEDYELTKTELVNNCMYDERIYQYNFNPNKIELVEEPENAYDPNAIKVIMDGEQVGYIKKGSCSHIKKLMKEDKIQSISGEIHGGKYKIVVSDYDVDKDKDVYEMEKDETNYHASIYITLK